MRYQERIAKYGREKVLAQKKADYQKHKDKRKDATYAARRRNKEKWLVYNREYQRKRRTADPDYWRKKAIEKQYGITIEDFYRMMADQGFCCLICSTKFDVNIQQRRPHIDHDHKTGQVRGILCRLCNVMLGSAREDAKILLSALAYLSQGREIKAG